MPVTQNYKIVTFSADTHLHAIIAVMTQLRADRALKRTPGDEYDKFLVDQINTGTEALAALNAASVLTREDTHGALEGALLATVLRELHWVLELVGHGYVVPGMPVSSSERRARIESLNAALLFLESPK